MNRLSKEKRNQLILASAAIVLVMVGIYFTLIRYQQSSLASWATKKAATEKKMSEIRDSIKNSRLIEAQLLVVSNKLALQEEDMPTGDLYASMVNTLRKFKLGHKVEIPQFNSPGTAVDVTLLPKFPYKQVVMTIIGTAYYHDLGRFIADYENEFPTSRIVNLDISPASVQSPDEKEKLAFKMDIVSLVKGTTPSTTSKL
jgi:Tfp pilus assembly protein PilO